VILSLAKESQKPLPLGSETRLRLLLTSMLVRLRASLGVEELEPVLEPVLALEQ
jgi:hypothetical protein